MLCLNWGTLFRGISEIISQASLEYAAGRTMYARHAFVRSCEHRPIVSADFAGETLIIIGI